MHTSSPQTARSTRREAYVEAARDLRELLADEFDPIARMATICAVLRFGLPHVDWVGFYRVARPGEELVIGPYQGTLGCLRIRFERGVCGAAARSGHTQVVPDVAAFPGHIACDSASRSEIVIPVFDPAGALIAVLDLDSHTPAAFGDEDRAALEALVGEWFAQGPA